MDKTFTKQSISDQLAQQLIDAAIAKAKEIGKPMVIAIVDESGLLKCFKRMDGAPLVSIEVAQNKAYTAVANPWGHATHEIYDFIRTDPAKLIGIPHFSRYCILGGGFPIKINNITVGGIGVSGGKAEQDMEVAKTGLKIIE